MAVGLLIVSLFSVQIARAQSSVPADQREWEPAQFVRFVNLPGEGTNLRKPRVLHFDRFHQELLVSESGRSRIVVFTPAGAFDFEFTVLPHLNSVRDIATDPDGYIYVLGAKNRQALLAVFDFDGLFLRTVDLKFGGRQTNPTSLACADDGRLFTVDPQLREIHVFQGDGQHLATHSIGETADPVNDIFGNLTVTANEILLPASSRSTVLRFELDGTPKASLGVPGTLPGSLNFPVAAEMAGPDLILVLDRSRFVVIGFLVDGTFVGEFGGKGYRPGWFYQPAMLAVPGGDTVVVGQVLENLVQICRLPDFIRDRVEKHTSLKGAPTPALTITQDGFAPLKTKTRAQRRSTPVVSSYSASQPDHGGSQHLPANTNELPVEESE